MVRINSCMFCGFFTSLLMSCNIRKKIIQIVNFRIQKWKRNSTFRASQPARKTRGQCSCTLTPFFIWLNGIIRCRQNFKRHDPSPGHGKRTKESKRQRGTNSKELTTFPLPVSSVKLFQKLLHSLAFSVAGRLHPGSVILKFCDIYTSKWYVSLQCWNHICPHPSKLGKKQYCYLSTDLRFLRASCIIHYTT